MGGPVPEKWGGARIRENHCAAGGFAPRCSSRGNTWRIEIADALSFGAPEYPGGIHLGGGITTEFRLRRWVAACVCWIGPQMGDGALEERNHLESPEKKRTADFTSGFRGDTPPNRRRGDGLLRIRKFTATL